MPNSFKNMLEDGWEDLGTMELRKPLKNFKEVKNLLNVRNKRLCPKKEILKH